MSKQIEDSLAPIVYSQLQDQLPELFKYLIGFQLLDQKNDGARSLGLLAFNINGKHFYMPAFYINGYLKPLILLYSYEKGNFLPAIKKVIDMLLKPHLGFDVEPIEQNAFQDVISLPRMQLPLSLGKYAALNLEKVLDTHITAEFIDFMKSDRELLRKTAELHPELLEKIIKYGSPTKSNLTKKSADITIIDEPSPDYSAEDNLRLYRGDVLVQNDTRSDFTHPVLVEDNIVYGPPAKNGKYKILDDNSKFLKKWVILHPTDSSQCYVIDGDTLECEPCGVKDLLAIPIEPNLDNLLSKTVPMGEMSKGVHYILMNYHNKTTHIFEYNDGINKTFTLNPHTTDEISIKDPDNIVISRDLRALPVVRTCCSFCPGTFKQLNNKVRTMGAEELTIDKEASFRDNMKLLILKHNIKEADARAMIERGGRYRLVKSAFSPVTQHEEQEIPRRMPSNPERRTPDVNFSNQKNDINFAMRASRTGNSNIFDAALLGILSKSQNDTERVKSILPIINQVIHSLGTILFMLWWNPDSYAKEFSTDDLYELEQSVLSTFKELGSISVDLTLVKKLQGNY